MSDRTCCVCRREGRPTQIHHLDDDPANNDPDNLALLCLDCHNATQIRGGFGRSLNQELVRLYRADWTQIVAARRASNVATSVSLEAEPNLALITSLVEIYRSQGQLESLAMFYNAIGNAELRDRVIEEILADAPSDGTLVFYRAMQGKLGLIPDEVKAREEARLRTGSPSDLARFYKDVGHSEKAAESYARFAIKALEEGNTFSAAFYLREMETEGVVDGLFLAAMQRAEADGDLWWQIRCFQELGWNEELNAFLLAHGDEIEATGELLMLELLAAARGDRNQEAEVMKLIAATEWSDSDGVFYGARNVEEARRLIESGAPIPPQAKVKKEPYSRPGGTIENSNP